MVVKESCLSATWARLTGIAATDANFFEGSYKNLLLKGRMPLFVKLEAKQLKFNK